MRARGGQEWLLEAFGARIGLAGEIADHDAILRALPQATIDRYDRSGTTATPDVEYRVEPLRDGGGWSFERSGSEVSSGEPDLVRQKVIDSLHFDVALHAREATFLHASVVSWRGQLLVFPGRSRSGKSTLAAFLAGRGATYYSDEYAPIDPQGRILPYPKSISLRPDMTGRWSSAGETVLGLPAAPPHAVIFTRFQPSARFRPRPVTVEAAALSLVDNSVIAGPRPRQTAEAVARLLAHRPRLVESARGDAEAFAAELLEWLAAAG